MKKELHSIYRSLLIVLALSFYGHILSAQVNSTSYIYINGQKIAGSNNIEQWVNEHLNINSPQQVLLQFRELPSDEVREQLKGKGIHLQDYIPDNAFIATVCENADVTILRYVKASYILQYQPKWKISKSINTSEKNSRVLVGLFNTSNKEELAQIVANYGGAILESNWENLNKFVVALPSAKLNSLAAWHGVQYVSSVPQDVPLNFESKTASRTNNASLAKIYGGLGLTGKDIVIGVGDNVSGIFHIDLKDRIINYNPAAYTDHGVHINGIVGGAGIMDPKGEGVAPEATLINHYFSNVISTTPSMHDAYGMTITNNSYAALVGNCEYAGVYDNLSNTVDRLALDFKDILHVFASGNDGYLNCAPYPDGFATVTGGYQPAKNNIVVNSTNKWFVNAYDGSRGPVKDGRLKPEITAVGVEVNSTTKEEEYLVAAGTSMASPGVAGAAALLAERYKQLHSNITPKSDLLKALLLNGATDIGNPGPDYRFGFGFLNLEHALTMLDSTRYTSNVAFNGTQQQQTITVPAGVAKLKVMLCWHDVPANPSASKQLVNDLDIEVTDPNNTVHLPMVLDETPANILSNATQKRDRLNNVEQVIINNPPAGNYNIIVRGHSIPNGNQQYVVTYDFEQEGVQITYPARAAQVKADDSLRIYWYASDNANNFTLEYSTDNGGNWNNINNNIDAKERYFVWYVPNNINSGECKLRLSRNNTAHTFTTDNFAINTQPLVVLDANQCPGYMNINWAAIPNATGYEVLQKKGAKLEPVDTVAGTNYVFSGLAINEWQYVAVRPMLNGIGGYRSLAVKRLPNDGACNGTISDNDLMLERVLTPRSGRVLTTSSLIANTPVIINIRNLDNDPVNNYRVSYKVNNGSWQSQTFTDPINGAATKAVTLAPVDLSALGDYTIQYAVENLAATDPVTTNDSFTHTVRQLKNDPINIANGFTDDFESMGKVETSNDSMGISTNEHWDYYNDTDTGRLRSYAGSNIVLSGSRSISMDAYKDVEDNQNELIGTFNLTGTNAKDTEVRLEFDYMLHGRPRNLAANEVSVRGNDLASWEKIFTYNGDRKNIGQVQNSGTLSVSDIFLKYGQDFSTSFQLKFTQYDTSVIATRNYGSGLTIDNVKLYTVQNDVELVNIVTPIVSACDRSNESPLRITIHNGVNQTQNNVQLFYRVNDGTVVTETLSELPGKATVSYTFNKKVDLSAIGTYKIDVWLAANGDTYLKNDSILNYQVRSQPYIRTYTYKEDFENSNGGWYADGINSSWEYGNPKAAKISKASSGANAWVTNLSGNYNNNEQSHLYSPCFDVSNIANPVLSFKLALDVENCGGAILCDAAYLEYSVNGGMEWSKLDTGKEMTNWYNDTSYKIWSVQDETEWRTASISLPTGASDLRLRFTLASDPAANFEGIGIDDIMITDKKYYLPNNDIISLSPNPTANSMFSIEWAAASGTKMELSMIDLLGRVVHQSSATAVEGYNKTTIQTPQCSRGVYLLRIVIGDKKHERKIVYQ